MPELFDASIENLIIALRKQRVGKRIFAYENLIEKRIIRDEGTPVIEGEAEVGAAVWFLVSTIGGTTRGRRSH